MSNQHLDQAIIEAARVLYADLTKRGTAKRAISQVCIMLELNNDGSRIIRRALGVSA